MNKTEDKILLDRIKQLDNENEDLRNKLKKSKPFIDLRYLFNSIGKATKNILSSIYGINLDTILITFLLIAFASGVAFMFYAISHTEVTGKYYPVYINHPKYNCYMIKKEIDWRRDIRIGKKCFKEIDVAHNKAVQYMKSWVELQKKHREFDRLRKEILNTTNE